MNLRKILMVVIFCFCCTKTVGQIESKQRKMLELYLTSISNEIKAQNNYLVILKNPDKILKLDRNYLILKRLSYNTFIVRKPNYIDKNQIIFISAANNLWKASDNLVKTIQDKKTGEIGVQIAMKEGHSILNMSTYGKIISRHGKYLRVKIKVKNLSKILADERVDFADLISSPKEDVVINNIDLSANSGSEMHAEYPSINGEGINISVKEDKFDVDDLDLLKKFISTGKESPNISNHATTIATLISGRGNSFIKGLGLAPHAKLASSDFINLFPDSTSTLIKRKILLQNHSYGTAIENYYGNEALEYDKQIFINDSITHVFSSGNAGTSSPLLGLYSAISSLSNLTGNFKQAKNVIIVGGTSRENIVQPLSSKGPTYDGRIKPDIVANGEDGTSGSAAITTGVIALIQQSYKGIHKHLPSSALIKCLLINSAEKVTNNEIDFTQGFGKLNTLKSIKTLNERRFFSGALSDGQIQQFKIDIPNNVSKVTITIAWNDPPAIVNAVSALVNDLDLEVRSPSGEIILPWVLSSYPNVDSLNKAPVRLRDSLNNVEQISFKTPMPGSYTILIKGHHITSDKQPFYVVYDYTFVNQFKFSNPSLNTDFITGDRNYVRWESTFTDKFGNLSVSYDNGQNWSLIGQVILSLKYKEWIGPNLFTKALFKMEIGNQSFISKPFVISSPVSIKVGFNCQNDLLLYWNKQANSTGYNVYNINNDSLQLLIATQDTLVRLNKNNIFSNYFAVSSNSKDGFEGLKSYTIDVTMQGVECYVQALLADIISNQTQLTLSLATLSNLSKIIWQKQISSSQFVSFGETVLGSTNQKKFTFSDPNPRVGKQYYRVLLVTNDHKEIVSDVASVFFLKSSDYRVFPIPCSTNLNIISGSNDEYDLNIVDVSGKIVKREKLSGVMQSLSVLEIKSGIHTVIIRKQGKIIYSTKIVKL